MSQVQNRSRIRNQLSQNLFGDGKASFIDLASKNCSLEFQQQEIDLKKETIVSLGNQVNLGIFEQKYFIGSTIGQGAHAIVKIAKLISDPEQIFAVKISRTGDPEIISTFIDTYKNVRFLNHPNILKQTETLYCVMDYCRFQSLQKMMKKQKIIRLDLFYFIYIISENKARSITKYLLLAIEHMHQMGISHRDLKPDNILVGQKDEDVKIIDFGVSKRFITFVNQNRSFDSKQRDMWTRTGNYLYCAPEIFAGGGYNEKIDLWSVGVILYQMLTAQLPFLSETVFDTIEIITQYENFLNLGQLQISNLAKDCIKRLLQASPNERVSAQECLKHPWFYQVRRSTKQETTTDSLNTQKQNFRSQSNNRNEDQEVEKNFFERNKHSRSCTYLVMQGLKKNEKQASANEFEKIQKKDNQIINAQQNASPLMNLTKIKQQINLEIHIHKVEEHPKKSFQLRKMRNIYDL